MNQEQEKPPEEPNKPTIPKIPSPSKASKPAKKKQEKVKVQTNNLPEDVEFYRRINPKKTEEK